MITVSENHLKGNAYQHLFCAAALRRGLLVETPEVPAPWDFRITNLKDPDTSWRVQVKGTESPTKKDTCKRYRLTLKTGKGKTTKPINAAFVDVVVGYVEDTDTWYNIPVSSLSKGVKTVCLYPHNRNSKGKYEIWKYDWSVYESY